MSTRLIGVLLALGCAMACGTASAQTAQPKTTAVSAADATLAAVFAKKADTDWKINANGAWETSYKGKALSLIAVRVIAIDDVAAFFVNLFDRDKLTLSRNLLLKTLEMNSDYDFVKLALNADSLYMRIDVRLSTLTPEEIDALAGQAAQAADSAYTAIKDFLP